MAAILPLLYLPPTSWFSALQNTDTVYIEAHDNYQKGSYRNRCHLSGSHGLIRLSIPLSKGKHQQMPSKDVLIDDSQNWQVQHWRTIQSAYGKSPFFEFYSDELKVLYTNKVSHLFDWNLELLHWMKEQLNIQTNILLTTEYLPEYPDKSDLRTSFSPKQQEGLNLKPYPQVFEDRFGFIPNLSILDLLFCMGPEAPYYL